MPLLGTKKSFSDKIDDIRIKHWRIYRPKFLILLCVYSASVVIFVVGILVSRDDLLGGVWWGRLLWSIGGILICCMPFWIFSLGNRDDRVYFLRCIEAANDECELSMAGFDKYKKIEDLIFSKMIYGNLTDLACNKKIRELHRKFDLRKIADEVEDYESALR